MAYATHTTEALMRIFGLEHARDTVVGDASLRGISGGEKKRVSLAEVMSARGKLVCWDKYVFFVSRENHVFDLDSSSSTRGLDSSTALEFIQALRVATDTAKVTTIVSIYQAGEQLFELFDKVCLIYEGKMTYFGPAREAKRYFVDMGYEPLNRQTTTDFLVASMFREVFSVISYPHGLYAATDPRERKIRPGFRGVIPRTADEMVAYFSESTYGQLNRTSTDSYYNLYVNKPELKNAYDTSAASEHAQHAPSDQPYTLSIPMQIRAVMRRRWRIVKGDRTTQFIQLGWVPSVLIPSSLETNPLQITADRLFSREFSSGLCSSESQTTRVHTIRGVVCSTCRVSRGP